MILTQLARYGAVGLVNTGVGVTCIFAAKALFGAQDLLANAIGFSVGFVISFLLNKNWTFSYAGRSAGALPRYASVVAAAYLANVAVLELLVRTLGIDGYLAQVIAVAVYSIIVFVSSRLYVFASAK